LRDDNGKHNESTETERVGHQSNEVTMSGIFESVKRVLTGEVLDKFDTEIGGPCIISLRLKRDKRSGDKYVVLAALSAGNYQYYPFDLDEFDRFVEAAKRISTAAHSGSAGMSPNAGRLT
jgi:hypothetical protein